MKVQLITVGRLVGFALVGAIVAAMVAQAIREVRADDPPPTAGVLTDESLGKMLTDMGYEFKAEKGDTFTSYRVTVNRDEWPLRYQVNLANKQFLTILVILQEIPKENAAMAAHLRALLEAGNSYAASFAIDKSSNMIVLFKAVDNRAITPATLRRIIDDVDAMTRKTVDLWNTPKWSGKPATARTEAKEMLPSRGEVRTASPPPPQKRP